MFLLAVAVGLFAVPRPAWAQQSGRMARVGYLVLSPLAATPSPARAAFVAGLRELDYEAGKNLVIEYRSAYLRAELLPDLVQELIEAKVDVIFAVGTQVARAAKDSTKTVPIVFSGVSDPVGAGLVASLARPGGNVTGTGFMIAELAGKRLALLKELRPRASRVAVMWNPTDAAAARESQETQAAARRLNLALVSIEIRSATDVDGALTAITKERPDALVVATDPVTASVRPFVVGHVAAQRLPTIYGLREFVEAGGLMSYGASLPDAFRRAAGYVARILGGANPADLPVEQPTKFELVVNLKTARSLGLTIPASVLVQTDLVIE